MKARHSSAMPYGQESARFATVGKNHTPDEQDLRFENIDEAVGRGDVIENSHPVIRTHPDTGRKSLYVNRAFTYCFEGMSVEESLPLLEELWAHAARAEFSCRYRWSKNTVGIWDNRVTHHYAINDYFGKRRHMQRVAIHEAGRPV